MPSNLSSGQSLPDGKMIVILTNKSTGDKFATTTISIIKRKVEGKESITTTAGTFECWKISSVVQMETVLTMGMKMPVMEINRNEYFNKEVGIVKSERLSKTGQTESYSVLAKYSKP
jgi:hypothetical protein